MNEDDLEEIRESILGLQRGWEEHDRMFTVLNLLLESVVEASKPDLNALILVIESKLKREYMFRPLPDSDARRLLDRWLELLELETRLFDPEGAAIRARSSMFVVDRKSPDIAPANVAAPPGSSGHAPSVSGRGTSPTGEGTDEPEHE
jgi:hypothetical protein